MIRKISATVMSVAAGALVLVGTASANHHELTPAQAKAREIYETVIGMRTAKGHGKVPEMAAYLASELRSAGFAADDMEIIPSGETAAFTLRYRGDGSSDAKPVLFLAHMDVVDAKRDDWEHDPFTLREEDGAFLGRGVADNKYGIVNLTQSFMRLKQEGFVPNRDLILVFTGDEETDMVTTRMMAYDRPDIAEAEFALNSDAGGGAYTKDGVVLPYDMQAAEKTYATFNVTSRNPGGHSSRPRPDNAIYDLARALLEIESFEFPVMANDITRASARAAAADVGGDVGKAMAKFADDPKNKKAIKVLRNNVSSSNMLSTTCVATMLDAGHAENALPQSAMATVNCRIFPGVEIDTVRDMLAEVIDNDALSVEQADERYVSSPASDPRADVNAALSAAITSRYPGAEIVPSMSAGGTDGMHFRRAGIPTFGVSGRFVELGYRASAHGLNERLPVKTFYEGLDHWMILIKTLAGSEQE